MSMKVSVFGSANLELSPEANRQAYRLGKMLGEQGCTVLTGGYTGTMEVVSRGANEAGAKVIGVTSDEIEAYRPIGPNRWVTEEWRCKTFRERLDKLVENCDAAIALPGGLGTLMEISLTWNHLVIHTIEPKPLILIGPGWQKTMETFFAELGEYVPESSREYLTFAPNAEIAVAALNSFHPNESQK